MHCANWMRRWHHQPAGLLPCFAPWRPLVPPQRRRGTCHVSRGLDLADRALIPLVTQAESALRKGATPGEKGMGDYRDVMTALPYA